MDFLNSQAIYRYFESIKKKIILYSTSYSNKKKKREGITKKKLHTKSFNIYYLELK